MEQSCLVFTDPIPPLLCARPGYRWAKPSPGLLQEKAALEPCRRREAMNIVFGAKCVTKRKKCELIQQ